MATDAQISANRINAQASAGPTSIVGKSHASRNALCTGLYSAGDFVRPEEQSLYAEFCAGFHADLAPEGAIEQTLAAEVIHAAWRLRRCSVIEATMMPVGEAELDPLLDKTQQSIDRARAHAHRIFHRGTSELRRLQAERRSTFTKQTQSTPQPAAPIDLGIARNAPCTCGSGAKFKRCCGKGAPAILNRAA